MYFFWTLMIAVLTAVACSLCGTFLVVKREAFVSEGLSHAVLPGIIVAFLVFQDRSSPWLILFAGLTGLLMVWLVQAICNTKLVDQDASLGIVFSGLFSVGVILASLNLKNVHFHAHCIIDGDLAYAALKPFEMFGFNFGPKAFVVLLSLVIILTAFIVVFFKEMKLMIFDEGLSTMFGQRPNLLHTVWLALVSITAVAAFQVAGTILVVAMMIAPAAAANLLTNRLSSMFTVSSVIGTTGALAGVFLGDWLTISPAGPIASIVGFIFLATVFLAPNSGILSKWNTRKQQRTELLNRLVVRLVADSKAQVTKAEVISAIHCPASSVRAAIQRCQAKQLVHLEDDTVVLTDQGLLFADQHAAF